MENRQQALEMDRKMKGKKGGLKYGASYINSKIF
jgi:hypothetical protein